VPQTENLKNHKKTHKKQKKHLHPLKNASPTTFHNFSWLNQLKDLKPAFFRVKPPFGMVQSVKHHHFVVISPSLLVGFPASPCFPEKFRSSLSQEDGP